MPKAENLKQKEVIDINTAERLGYIKDVEISMEDGSIKSIIIPKRGRVIRQLFGDSEYIIPWQNIVRIGRDVVLVEINSQSEAVIMR